MNHNIFLAIGTNLGDRLANLRAALRPLPPDVELVAVSRVYETPPWGYADQPAFLNMAVHARTRLSPESLLSKLKQAEVQIGREPGFRWGPRLIDLDILFYDDLVLDTPRPDIAPELVHPVLGKTVCELLLDVDATEIVLNTEQIETTVTPKM
jgi:2-amino-4-hydroxy-6-hydroxymethyldihydropteridine diphosphokinase